jgi:predicted O-methyltransferase YrrM
MMNLLYTWLPSGGYYLNACELFMKSLVLWKMDSETCIVVLCAAKDIADKVDNISKLLCLEVEIKVVSDARLEYLSLWKDYSIPEDATVLYMDVKNLLCGPLEILFENCHEGELYCKKDGNTRYEYWGADFFETDNPHVDAFTVDVFLFQNSSVMSRYFSNVLQDAENDKNIRKSMIYHAVQGGLMNYTLLESKMCCNPPHFMDSLCIANFPRIRGTTSVEVKRMQTFFRHYILGEEGLLNYQSLSQQMKEHEVNMESFELRLHENQHHFEKIQTLCVESGEAVEGNCFFKHLVQQPVENKWKQLNLFWMASFSEHILEIGFNAGHSCLLFLLANPDSTIVLFDLCEHRYTKPCFNYLNQEFPGRLTLIPGDSTKSIPLYANHYPHKTFDMVHIDGGHTMEIANSDFFNILPLASRMIIWDDTDFPHLNKLFEQYLQTGCIEEVQAKNTSITEHRIGQRSLSHQTYLWENSSISFLPNGEMNAFGKGRYVLLPHRIVHATFGNREHFIKFNHDYTHYVSIRKDDFFIVSGKINVEKVQVTRQLNLSQLNNNKTDKNTVHSYLELYDTLLKPIKDTAQNVLEIGIGDFGPKNGGSLLLWTNYFKKATIYGIDVLPLDRVLDEVISDESIKLYCNSDAYNDNFISKNLSNMKFDFLIDDGPHSLISQEKFVELYSPLLNENGILIIEDVQDISWLENLKNKTPEHLQKYIKTYDLRKNKGRYDDIVFTIDKVVR